MSERRVARDDRFSVDAEARFWPKVDKDAPNGCWEWTAYRLPKGYGQFTDGLGRQIRAHRFAYELLVGPIPEGLVIDHLCRNRACVNPAHLEPVTNHENILRGTRVGTRATHCRNGHERTPENTRLKVDGSVTCRVCQRTWHRRRSAERRSSQT